MKPSQTCRRRARPRSIFKTPLFDSAAIQVPARATSSARYSSVVSKHNDGLLLERVEQTIADYDLLPSRDVLVACSGGKDSVYACRALRELDFQVTPILVDMGYETGWAERVTSNLRLFDFVPVVLMARTVSAPVSVSIERREALRQNLRVVDSLGQDARLTPCTSCYNSKILLLVDYLDRSGVDRIVFAHHATDATASLLKSALMYIDRWDRGNATYDPNRFRDLARMARTQFESNDRSWAVRLKALVLEGKASTDEPPVQAITYRSGALIVRPLLGIWEHEVESQGFELGQLEASGCGHTLSQTTQTPREIVQFETVRPLEANASVRDEFLSLMRVGLSGSGRLQADARRNRDSLLGPQYKVAPGGLKKL